MTGTIRQHISNVPYVEICPTLMAVTMLSVLIAEEETKTISIKKCSKKGTKK